jgi:hypothetical protein
MVHLFLVDRRFEVAALRSGLWLFAPLIWLYNRMSIGPQEAQHRQIEAEIDASIKELRALGRNI